MRRREFLFAGGTTIVLPFSARAQQPAIPVVGYLSSGHAEKASYLATEFRDGLLAATGLAEGKNVAFEYRYANQDPNRLPALALDLVALRVSVVGVVGYAALHAMRAATQTIPIVAIDMETDPIEVGLAVSLPHPGGNVTGVFSAYPELAAKWLELLKEASERLARVAVLFDPSSRFLPERKVVEDASSRLKISVEFIEVRTAFDIDRAFDTAVQHDAGAVLMLSTPLFFAIEKRAAELAVQHKLPAFFWESGFARAGGLMSYGVNMPNTFRKIGVMAGKVLQGAKPADLAIERPSKFELIINLKTAKAIGLAIPDKMIALADEVIE